MWLIGNQSFFRKSLASAVLVVFASLLLYSWTLAPTVTLVDSGELIVAAHSLGVAHPPGFPLYLILAHLASLVPIGSVAQRVNFASAIFAALACGLLTLVVAELLIISDTLAGARPSGKARRKKKPADRSTAFATESGQLTVLPAAVAGGVLLACSRTLWAYATITEVYTLNALLMVAVFFLLLRWRRRVLADVRNSASGEHDRLLLVAAIVFGLALGVHHVTVALTLPALAVIVYRTAGAKFFFGKRLLFAALFALVASLVVYSYLPLAATRDPILNWGNPRALPAIWSHITGWQYRVFFSFSPGNVVNQLPQLGRFLVREFGMPWLPLTLCFAAIGFVAAFRRDRTTFFFLLLILLADVGYCMNYDIAEDKDAYYLPTFIAVAIAAALGLHRALQFLAQRFRVGRIYSLVALVIFVVPALALASNWPFNNRRHYFIAQDYADNILNSVEPNGLVLTLDWQVASPMLYVREIEHRRPDVKVVDVNLLRRSWYFDYLKRAYPDLIEQSHDKIDNYLAELQNWERDPTAYAKSAALTRRIASKFEALLESMVTRQLQSGQVYLTSELILLPQGQESFSDWLNKNYQAVPRGVVFQLFTDQLFHDPGPFWLQTRGLADGTIRFEPDDVASQKVLPVYKTMLVNRGRYFAHFGDYARAVEAFTKALALDPHFELALEGLRQSRAQLGNAPP